MLKVILVMVNRPGPGKMAARRVYTLVGLTFPVLTVEINNETFRLLCSKSSLSGHWYKSVAVTHLA